jgi:hypothetical protein
MAIDKLRLRPVAADASGQELHSLVRFVVRLVLNNGGEIR